LIFKHLLFPKEKILTTIAQTNRGMPHPGWFVGFFRRKIRLPQLLLLKFYNKKQKQLQ